MTAVATASPHAAFPRVSLWSRVYGFGSVYAKTLRDSRLSIVVMAGLLAGSLIATGAQYGKAYGTLKTRTDFVSLLHHLPPPLAGLYGTPSPAHLETLGGLVAFKVAAFMALAAGFWSILALSATICGEARRGSLEFVAVTPLGLRRIALEKLAAHLTGMVLVLAAVAGASWLVGAAYGTLPGDAVPAEAALGFALWIGLLALASGSVAFALAPLLGRAPAAAIAGAVTLGGYLVNGYSASVPVFGRWANVTWYGWTVRNQPLAGQYDWGSLVPVALIAVVLLAAGVEIFARRDLGAPAEIPWLRFPSVTLGLGGPISRSLGERLPLALAWGAGLGLFGLVIGASTASFSATLANVPSGTLSIFHLLFPKIDLTTAGGFLQLTFVQFGFIFAGFAAATLVGGWASDETAGRLEMLLTAPLSRARWAIASGLGVLAAIVVMTALLALGIAVGVAIGGGGLATPVLGTGVLGLYAAGLAGAGLAVGGLARTSLAAEAVAVAVIATFLIDLIAPALQLPEWVHSLALTDHLGQPMIGSWDWAGIAACVALALGGLALSAWGFSRRDVGT